MNPIKACFSCFLFAVLTVFGAENLIVNGEFIADQVDFPPFWEATNADQRYCHGGGPEGRHSLMIMRGTVRQNGLSLVPGEKYYASGWFRTSGGKAEERITGLTVASGKWVQSTPMLEVPGDTAGKWVFVEGDYTMCDSKDGYNLILWPGKAGGMIEVSDLKLVALTERAQEESTSLLESGNQLPVPVDYLDRIDSRNPQLKFRWSGKKPAEAESLDYVYRCGQLENRVPFSSKGTILHLDGIEPGSHHLEITVVHRVSNSTVGRWEYKITVKQYPAFRNGGVKQNNLVRELMSLPVTSGTVLKVPVSRPGWLFFTADAPIDLEVNDQKVLAHETTPHEAFRYFDIGEYPLAVKSGSARLIVREVPEISNYPCVFPPRVAGNGTYDWKFLERYALPAINSLSAGKLSEAETADVRRRGLLRTINLGGLASVIDKHHDPTELSAYIAKSLQPTPLHYDGITLDEFFFARPKPIQVLTSALKQLHNPADLIIHTYVVGMPMQPHLEFISTAINISSGRGRLLWESYLRTKSTEEQARQYISQNSSIFESYRGLVPRLLGSVSVIMANFNQLPLLSMVHYPEVDFKYFLDLQCHALANDPAYQDLRGLGWWATYYADEEIARWSFALLRHYAVEGHTEMLSAKFGYRYLPGIVADGDFREGLQHWQEQGSAEAVSIDGLGKMQRRYDILDAAGDSGAMLAPATGLSQKLCNIETDKAYVFTCLAADYDALRHNHAEPRELQLAVTVNGTETIPGKSFQYVDDRKRVHRTQEGKARWNYIRVVFRAKSTAAELMLTNKDGKPLFVNTIAVNPYFE